MQLVSTGLHNNSTCRLPLELGDMKGPRGSQAFVIKLSTERFHINETIGLFFDDYAIYMCDNFE